MNFGHHILEYKEDILQFLSELISIPSVADPESAEEGMPYGPEAARALNLVLSKAEEMGFETVNAGNFAGHAEYHSGEKGIAGILTHIDVVPKGSGWHYDPFQLTIVNDIAYGRGTTDDKGAAVAALFAMKSLKDHGITGKRSLRCIFGSGEEIGMDDMRVYFSRIEKPDMAFTPDADYGICNCEKGIVRIKLQSHSESKILKNLYGGTVPNAVPDTATAVLHSSMESEKAIQLKAKELDCRYEIVHRGEDIVLTVFGKSVHAMEPEKGINAITQLITLLHAVYTDSDLGDFVRFYGRFLTDSTGERLGISYQDSVSGPLTMNVGIYASEKGSQSVILDIRYPATMDYKSLITGFEKQCSLCSVDFEVTEHIPPLFVNENSDLVRILRKSYRNIMGEDPEIYSTGGGTYARSLRDRCVAFGPVFAEEPSRRLHQSDEHMDLNFYMKHAQICLEAMYHLIID